MSGNKDKGNEGISLGSAILVAGGAAAIGYMAGELWNEWNNSQHLSSSSGGSGPPERRRPPRNTSSDWGSLFNQFTEGFGGHNSHTLFGSGANRGLEFLSQSETTLSSLSGLLANQVAEAFGGHNSLSKEHREENNLQARKKNRTTVHDKDIPDTMKCVACWINPKEILIEPCGHVCLCEDCSEKISNKCPICAAKIGNKKPVYL